MEYKISETFEFNGKKLKCVLNNGLPNVCEKCALNDTVCFTSGLVCTPNRREDRTDVYFIEIKEENNMSSRKLNNNEDVKEQIITPPDGYEIDKENSTFECIKFKKKEEVAWRNKKETYVNGFYIGGLLSDIKEVKKCPYDKTIYNVFATEKQAKSTLAMARISQIMANDKRFGGVVTDEEWIDADNAKYVIYRSTCRICFDKVMRSYFFLAFHTKEQRDLFLKENEDLIKDYLMID